MGLSLVAKIFELKSRAGRPIRSCTAQYHERKKVGTNSATCRLWRAASAARRRNQHATLLRHQQQTLSRRLKELEVGMLCGRGRWRRQFLLKVPENTGGQLGCRRRTAKIETLRLFPVGAVEEGGLFRGLDALDGYMHVQLTPQGDDRLYHCLGVAVRAVEALHEAAIDLDLVKRESPQIAQA